MAVTNPPVELPVINGSTGVWGTILNNSIRQIEGYINTNLDTNTTQGDTLTTLTNDVTNIKNTFKNGMMAVSTSTTRPPAVVGLIGLETDTGYLYYCASISGVATRVPFPGQYLAKLRQTSSQTFNQGSAAAITYGVADTLRGGGWSSGSRYTAQVPGIYEFTGAITFGANATGYRTAMWYKGGTPVPAGAVTIPATPITPTSASSVVTARTMVIGLNTNDYVELYGVQSGATTLNTDVAASLQSGIYVKYLGYYA